MWLNTTNICIYALSQTCKPVHISITNESLYLTKTLLSRCAGCPRSGHGARILNSEHTKPWIQVLSTAWKKQDSVSKNWVWLFFFTKGGISEECGWWLCISCRWGSWHHLLVKIRYYKNILIFLKPSIQISWHHLLVRLWYYEIFQYSGNLEFKYLGIICCICLFGTAFLFLRT